MERQGYAYVYILASKGKRLYIGVTSNLEKRIWEHKTKAHPDAFTSRYNIDQLVHFERYGHIHIAIAREKQLKGWLRVKKIALIVSTNPAWQDLSRAWGKPLDPCHPERSEGPPYLARSAGNFRG